MKKLMAWFKDEEGQGMVEYALLIGLISIVAIAVLLVMGPRIRTMFQAADNALTTTGG